MSFHDTSNQRNEYRVTKLDYHTSYSFGTNKNYNLSSAIIKGDFMIKISLKQKKRVSSEKRNMWIIQGEGIETVVLF